MSKSLYPAQQHQQHQPAPAVSEDERMARALQAHYDREAAHVPGPRVVAQPGFVPADLPFSCGHCGLPHVVRHAANNTVFRCARCGRENEIAIHQNRPVVVLRSRAAWVPVPIFCSIQ